MHFTLGPIPRVALVWALTWTFSCNSALADLLVMANGDRLTGKLIKREKGKIYFHSQIFGDLVAPEAGATVEEAPASPTPSNSLVGLPPPAVAKVPPKPPAVTKVLVTPWSGKIEFGYENTINSDVRTTNSTFRGQAERTVGKDDILFKVRFLYGQSAGQTTTDQADGEFRWRHNLSDRVFSQSDTTFDTDKIRQINYEYQEDVGLGYKLLHSARQTVDAGASVIAQELGAAGVQHGIACFGSVFQDYTYKISGRYTLSENMSAQYSPQQRSRYGFIPNTNVALSGSEQDYAYKFQATWQGQISHHLSLNLHFDYEFDNAILDNNARGSQRISTSLGYGF